MVQELKGQLSAGKNKFAIVVSRFNEFVTNKLVDGAVDCLQRHGAGEDQITIIWVPGTIEITVVAKKVAESGNYSAVLCLGAVTMFVSRSPAASARSIMIPAYRRFSAC